MHPLFLLFSFFFSWPPHQLSSSTPFLYPNRRILHEPFVPLHSLPPSEPPNQPQPPLPPPILPSSTSSNPNPNPNPNSNPNPNPKHPFSTTTPDQSSSFFPFYPYPPPPPPPPSFSTFASFPANISSLVIPHSLEPKKSSSGRTLSLAITAVACITIMVAISAFVYRRRKHYNGGSDKTLRTESTLGLFPPNSETETTNRSQRLRHTSSTTSEFLYLGTVVNSHRIEDGTDSGDNDSRKMESPELQPLPRLSLRQHYSVPPPPPQAQVNEEHEEFFSPKGSSLCASENSGVNGLASWRVLPEQSDELSSSSYSSGSPLPNSSPGRAQLESSSSSRGTRSLSSSPERNQVLSPSSDITKNDALSERTLVENENALPRVSNESLAQASSSAFSLASSPEKAMHCDSLEQSPRMSSFSDRYRLSGLSSVPLSPTLLSSPERELSHIWNESEKFTNCVTHRKQHWEIPVFSIPTGPSHRVSLSLPPSLPTPPPLLPRRKQWAVPAFSGPVVGQPVSRPPELTPPSRPFVFLNPTTKVSNVELPISFQNSGGN